MFKFTIMTLAPAAVLGMDNNGSAGLSAGETKPTADGYKICEDYEEDRVVTLVSQEGDKFENVKANTVALAKLIETMIPDDDEETEIPLPNVKTEMLKKVVQFLKNYSGDKEVLMVNGEEVKFTQDKEEEEGGVPMSPIEKPLKSSNMYEVLPEKEHWYAQFVEVEQDVLFELILAANYMDIKPLLDLTCASVASMIKGKTPEDIRKTFNVVPPPQEPKAAAEADA